MPPETETQRKTENVILCMQVFTFAILCTTLLHSRKKKEQPRSISNIAIWSTCTILHYHSQPTLSMGLAMGYLAWISLPNNPDGMEDLPNHADFIRSLQILSPAQQDPPEECIICWDSSHPIALLPCNHRGCTRCLRAMGPSQTACPVCRKPLFSNADDWIMLMLSKTSSSVAAVNVTLSVFEVLQRVYTLQYGKACMSIAALGWYCWLGQNVFYAVSSDSNWWRLPPRRQDLSNFLGGFAFSVFALWTFLWNWRKALEGM